MRHLFGILIAGLSFASGFWSVAAIEAAISRSYAIENDVSVVTIKYTDDEFTRDVTLADAVTLRVNGVLIGTTEKQMLRALGKAVRVNEDKDASGRASEREYLYSGLTITTFDDGVATRVESIDVESGSWDINGISLGATKEEVRQRFGWPKEIDGDDLVYPDTSGLDTVFSFKDGRLVEVYALADTC